jgi:cytochrome c-type biogenesis protein CcmF
VQNNESTSIDAILEEMGLKIQFAGIEPEKNQPLFKVWRKVPDEKPFILIKAIIFPMINLLWAGCVLMAIGTIIAIYQRVKLNRQSPDVAS